MQQVSFTYLKSLVNDNSFQPEGIKLNAYSGTTTILIVYLSDEEHQGIKHMYISMVMHYKECCLYMQDGILPFMKSIEVDLKKARDRRAKNMDPGGVHSYALLVANYGGIMARLRIKSVRKPCSSSMPRLTMPGRTPMTWCSTICCIMMDNWQPSSPTQKELSRRNEMRSGYASTGSRMWQVSHTMPV